MAAVFLNLFLRRVFLTECPPFFVGKGRRGKGMRKAHSLEPEGRQGKLRGHRGQGKFSAWVGTGKIERNGMAGNSGKFCGN